MESRIEEALLGQHLVDVRQMHLEAVFLFVNILRHPVELAGLVKLGCCGGIDRKVA